VRRAKVALIERVLALGELDPPRLTISQRLRHLNLHIRTFHADIRCSFPEPNDASAAMPSQEPYRSTEVVRRALSELRRLDRYERHGCFAATPSGSRYF